MNRRAFITLLGGAATWSLAARAQQPMPVVGYLDFCVAEPTGIFLAAFRKGLGETGFIEGRNLAEHPGRLAMGCFRVDSHLPRCRRLSGICSPHHGHLHEGSTKSG